MIDGRLHVLETPLKADFAIVRAWKADRWGNLVFRKTARNFSPMMCMAAKVTIVEAEHIVEPGELDGDLVHVPEHLRAAHHPVEEPQEVDRAAHRPQAGVRTSMPLTREQIAQRIAQELKDGFYVNLGIGMPTLVANYVPHGRGHRAPVGERPAGHRPLARWRARRIRTSSTPARRR